MNPESKVGSRSSTSGGGRKVDLEELCAGGGLGRILFLCKYVKREFAIEILNTNFNPPKRDENVFLILKKEYYFK